MQKLLTFNREYKSYSGFWNGVPVLVMSTGMGGPSMAIAVEELQKIGVEDGCADRKLRCAAAGGQSRRSGYGRSRCT